MSSEFTSTRPPPPFNKTTEVDPENGQVIYAWGISVEERDRLTKLLGHDFGETKLGGTYVTGPPVPCEGCGKWTEFIDWVYTALQRDVHTADFIFNAVKNRQFPKETMHDVYCSECGKLTQARSRNNAEGGAASIASAGPLSDVSASSATLVPDGPGPIIQWRRGSSWLFFVGDETLEFDHSGIREPIPAFKWRAGCWSYF